MRFSEFIKNRKNEEASADLSKNAEVRSVQKQLEEVTAEMKDATEKGDAEKYNQLEERARILRNNLVVASHKMNTRALSKEEAKNAWVKYSTDYKKAFKKQYDKYHSAKQTLYKEFRQLAEMQNEALKEAEVCLEILPEAKNDIMLMDSNEAKAMFIYLNNLITYRENDNLRLIFNGLSVESIDNTPTLEEVGEKVTKKKTEQTERMRAEILKRHKILQEVKDGRKKMDAIYWVDFSKMTETEKELFFTAVR